MINSIDRTNPDNPEYRLWTHKKEEAIEAGTKWLAAGYQVRIVKFDSWWVLKANLVKE